MLFAKVVLALMLGRPAEQYLDAQRAAHLQRMRELTELKRTGGLVDALLADHGLFHLEADLRWIDMTAARLDALAEEVRPMTGRSQAVPPDADGCLIEARDVVLSFGQTPALRGASLSVAAGRDPGRDGAERVRQVDAAALPGRHPGPGLRRGLVRRPPDRHAAARPSAARCAGTASGSCSSSASWCPS